MSDKESYVREIAVSASPEAAYRALTEEIGKWWVMPDGDANKVGDIPVFRFGRTYWKMRVTELVSAHKVVWECIEANHIDKQISESAKKEWEGTTLTWEITGKNNGKNVSSIIHFVHDGLSPSLECYEVCKNGWDYFFVSSLKKYLDTGKGDPFIE